MHEWKRVRLGEVADEVTVGHVGPMVDEYRLSGVPFLRSQNVLPHRIDLSDIKFIDRDFHSKLKKSALRPGDVVTVRTGKPGTTSVVPDSLVDANCSDLVITRPGPALDARWLSYYVNVAASDYVSAHLVGAVQQHFNVGAAKNMVLHLPPLKEQQAIAEVLGALDDKIAANIRLASTTENLLHASFRAGVSVGNSDLVRVEDIVQRLQIPRRFTKDEILALGDFPVLDQSEDGILGFLNGDKFIEATEDAPVLYFGDHTCKLRISSEKFLVGPNTIPFIGAGVPSVVLFCALQGLQAQEEYRRHWQSLMKKETSIPDPIWCADFASKFKVFLTLLASAKRENSILATTRDSLLPQLMSGKIRVKDAEQMVGDVV